MAHGGQVLVEAAHLAGVRNSLTELAMVDHKGYSGQTRGLPHTAVPRMLPGADCAGKYALVICDATGTW